LIVSYLDIEHLQIQVEIVWVVLGLRPYPFVTLQSLSPLPFPSRLCKNFVPCAVPGGVPVVMSLGFKYTRAPVEVSFRHADSFPLGRKRKGILNNSLGSQRDELANWEVLTLLEASDVDQELAE
jgi:hypothetical protein